MKKRLPINIKLFNKKGDMVQSYSRTVKNRILLDAQVGLRNKDVLYGTCRVTYNTKKGYWNEFNFTNYNQLNSNLSVDTELDLIKEFI